MSVVVVRLKEGPCPHGAICLSIGSITPRRDVTVPDGDYLVVMSPVVVEAVDIEKLRGRFKCIICVGPSTAAAVGNCVVPREYTSYGVARLIKELTPGRVVVLRSSRGNDVLKSLLPDVHEVFVYDVVVDREKLSKVVDVISNAKAVVLTSSTVAEEVAKVVDLREKRVVAIGPVTARSLEKYGIPYVVAPEATIESAMSLACSGL
ncbi:MAG: uroporphyrinogen-III synthase [Pyrobaculum sp.]